MKIAIVHPSLAVKGGAENVVMWLAEKLSQRGHDISIFTLGFDKHLWPNFKNNFTIKNLNIENSKLGWVKAGFVFATKYRKSLQSFDVVNPHLIPSYVWASLAKKFSAKFPKVVWYCEEPPRNLYSKDIVEYSKLEGGNWLRRALYRIVDKRAVNSVDIIVANSGFTANWIKKIYGREASLCWPGVPAERFITDRKPEGKSILVVGKLLPLKNIASLLEAIYLIVKKNRVKELAELKLRIVGEGREKNKLRSLVREKGIQDCVDFLGFVSDSDLSQLYAESSVIATASLYEPFGLTIVEAMLNRRPVVAPNQGGPNEIVIDGVTGFLVNPLEPRELAEVLTKVLVDKKLARGIGEAGYRRAIDNFSLSKFVDRFEKLIM